jgi:hypothetical protein
MIAKKRSRHEEESEWGLSQDGWNEEDLGKTGLIDWIDDVDRLIHEIRVGKRNSYAKFGDTIKDLANQVKLLGREAIVISKDLKMR